MNIFGREDFLIITDYLKEGCNVADTIQQVIDENPNRTIYFPDGEYVLTHPILTPAKPSDSVSLSLSSYAVLKASDDWSDTEAMVRLGGKTPANDIRTNGSNYYFEGGIVDGNGRANGISIDGGRETAIRNVSIKHTRIGIHIKKGCNGAGSSDSDIRDVNIVGTGATDSIGVLVEGLDNSLTNMRIASVFIGVDLVGSGNFLRCIHPLYTGNSSYEDYENSCGFRECSQNWYQNCYSDQFGIGFRTTRATTSIFESCNSYWYSPREGKHIGFKADGKFNAVLTNFRVGSRNFEPEGRAQSMVLSVGESGGHGVIDRLIAYPPFFWDESTDQSYKDYVKAETILY